MPLALWVYERQERFRELVLAASASHFTVADLYEANHAVSVDDLSDVTVPSHSFSGPEELEHALLDSTQTRFSDDCSLNEAWQRLTNARAIQILSRHPASWHRTPRSWYRLLQASAPH
jgi:hypothetical protein